MNDNTRGLISKIVLSVIWLLWTCVMYYLLLPALNIHSKGLWLFIIFIMLFPVVAIILINYFLHTRRNSYFYSDNDIYLSKFSKILLVIIPLLFFIFIFICFCCSAIFHSSAYASILVPEDYKFDEDINQSTALSKIALMDTDSAIILGNREIGMLSSIVSQYDVSEDYTQIDYNGTPKKIAALDYAGFFKYMGNKENGVPGYVQVDPVEQNAEYITLDSGMKYIPSAYFSKDLRRHIRLQYPTKIFDNIHFEIDEDGNPYYIATVYKYTVGLFGCKDVEGAIICDPITGESKYYEASDTPSWVDNVYDCDLIIEQYNWYGDLSNGFINSLFGKKGCKKSTETISQDDDDDTYSMSDYGYIAKDGDIWLYTGVTSVNDDASNIGFILVNERTSEAHYYTIAGADESSAMSAAEGEVQEKGYIASFPSLINVDEKPTYVMVLKDSSGIVKLYAMVNVESYNIVTTATTLDECFRKYRELINNSGNSKTDISDENSNDNNEPYKNKYTKDDIKKITFIISDIKYVDIDGNTFVYLTSKDNKIFKQKFADNEDLIFLNANDKIEVEYVIESDTTNIMLDSTKIN